MNDQTTETAAAKPSRTRSALLFGLLAVMIGALAYDYKVARPSVELAYTQLVDLNIAVNADPNDKVTPERVAEALGKSPSETFKDLSDTVEVYSWRGGLFFRSHKLYVAYRVTPLGTLMSRTSKFSYDKHAEVYEEVYAQAAAAEANRSEFADGAAGSDGAISRIPEPDPADFVAENPDVVVAVAPEGKPQSGLPAIELVSQD